MARCVALVAASEDRARLRAALQGIAEPTFVGAVGEVLAAVRADPASVRVVVLEASDAAGHFAAGSVRALTRLFPGVPVIGYCSATEQERHGMMDLVRAGVHTLVFRRDDDESARIRRIVHAAERSSAAALVMHHLKPRLPWMVGHMVEHCLHNPERSHTVGEVARAIGVDRKTLFNHCRAEGYPAPRTVIGWSLLLLAAALLAAPGVTVEWVALQLEFPSATSLRNRLKRYTGMRPGELRRAGAVGELCERFVGAQATG